MLNSNLFGAGPKHIRLAEVSMLKRIANRLLTIAKEEGIGSVVARAATAAKHSLRRGSQDTFDTALGVDTSGEVSLWRLRISSANAKFGRKYQPTNPTLFLDAMSDVPVDFRDFTFIDLGCGKGRILILAAQKEFKKIMGIEFSAELTAIARSNICQAKVGADIVETDVSEFRFPDDNLIIYMYNPFESPVMDSVISNLLGWRKQSQKAAFIVYVNPTCRKQFELLPEFESIVDREGCCIWQLRNLAS
jgi:SAM-dependent methyltransferase